MVQPSVRLQVGPQGWSFGVQRKQSDHWDPRLGPHKLARVEGVCSLHFHAEEYGIHSTRQKLHCPIPTCYHHAGEDFQSDEQLDGHVRCKHPQGGHNLLRRRKRKAADFVESFGDVSYLWRLLSFAIQCRAVKLLVMVVSVLSCDVSFAFCPF
jgi:hypothetical protein